MPKLSLWQASKPGLEGEIFNVVDDELPTARQFLQAYKKRVGSLRCFRMPYPLAYALCALWEEYSETSLGQLPPFSIAAAARLNGKETATPIRNFMIG